ncbi:ClpXP adapter SpxH family protein [Neobacillus dielmonensis]|uniref:ClpXP adapter SpxH family protein n=1 Tax=Neobacillus dielmonensis TaxID=1347369 RepID=UPI0005A6A946|nr:ClpXP adapter SpxH family protein [Neobacillus dielmonensis]
MNHLSSENHKHSCHGSDIKPIEIYMFIDPLSLDCWSLEPVLKKLRIEYGRYFSLKHVLIGRLSNLNHSKKKTFESITEVWDKVASKSGLAYDKDLLFENSVTTPYYVSIALKAAELQGRRAGIRYMRSLQEVLFVERQNITDIQTLIDCAKRAGLDVQEFSNDIHSESAARAFQCDLKITVEMDVTEIPTLVFFNENVEDEGIKITGTYPYEVYVEILEEMLTERPVKSSPPPLETFIKIYKFVTSKEIALIYNMPISQIEREMKKLILKQMVEQIPARYGTYWRYIAE